MGEDDLLLLLSLNKRTYFATYSDQVGSFMTQNDIVR